jgi:Fur family ferric uptake transcriptional regulator
LHHTIDDVRQKLSDKEYKLTPQRKIVLAVFSQNQEKHLSAEDVYGMVKKTHPEIGLATVYRTLDLFAELDVLQKNDFGDGRYRYEFCQAEAHHHHHLICRKCGIVTEFADDLLEALENFIEQKNGFQIIDHELKFYGYCKECRKM